MAKQLHKKFSGIQIKELINRYLEGKAKREHIQDVMGIKKTIFFALLKKYRCELNFTIEYVRKNATNKIPLTFRLTETIVRVISKKPASKFL